jgi:hypothetical protein
MQPPYFEPPPMVSPLGSAAIPPVPNPTRPVNETVRMAEVTDRNATPHSTGRTPSHPPRRALHPVVKIFLESVLVFGLCLFLYFIIRSF